MRSKMLLCGAIIMALMQVGYAQAVVDMLATTEIETDFNLIFLPITVNGQELFMIMDTGAGFSVIDEEVANSLSLPIDNLRIMERPGGDVRLGKIEEMVYTIGGLSGSMPIASANLAEGGFNDYLGRSCAGILGYDFISNYGLEVDYAHRQITFMDSKAFTYEKEGRELDLTIIEGMPIVLGTINQGGQNLPGRWLIDTGSLMSLGLNESYFKKYLADSTQSINSLAVGFGGSTPGKMYKLDRFELAGFEFNEVIAGHPENGINDETFDGVLGGELLSRFKLIMNYATEELYLEENAKLHTPIRWDLSGMLLTQTSKGTEILFVYAHSPAARAGIIPGDVITNINGIQTSEIGLPTIWSKFHHRVGEAFMLELKREGMTFQREIVLEDYVE